MQTSSGELPLGNSSAFWRCYDTAIEVEVPLPALEPNNQPKHLRPTGPCTSENLLHKYTA